ncbi:MAG: DUF3592 domain-containing protein [Polyangiaceae bacterium]
MAALLLIHTFLFGIGAVLVLWLMRRPWRQVRAWLDAGGHAQAQLVRYVETRAGRGSSDAMVHTGNRLYREVYAFQDRTGARFEVTLGAAYASPSPIGTTCEVAYDPADPSRARTVSGAKRLSFIGGALGASFVILTVASFVGGVALLL